jgi:hypothetical protein
MRQAVAVLVGAAVSAVSALILGEYELKGVMAGVAGVLFGVVIAEVIVAVGKHPPAAVAVISGLLAAAAMAWSGWIAAGRTWHYFGTARWVALAISAVTAPLWVRSAGRRAPDSEPSP